MAWQIRKAGKFTLALVAAGGMLTGVAGAGNAGTVQVRALAAQGRVEVEAADGQVDEILTQIGKVQEIKFERVGDPPPPRTWSGRLSGAVEDVLARLLENENFVVEHAKNAKSGIARVKVFAAIDPNDEEAVATTTQGPQVARPTPQPTTSRPPSLPTHQQRLPPQAAASTTASIPAPAAANSIRPAAGQPAIPQTRSTQTGAQRRGGVM